MEQVLLYGASGKTKFCELKWSIPGSIRGCSVTPKSVPPKIGPAGPILAEKLVPPGPFLLPK